MYPITIHRIDGPPVVIIERVIVNAINRPIGVLGKILVINKGFIAIGTVIVGDFPSAKTIVVGRLQLCEFIQAI